MVGCKRLGLRRDGVEGGETRCALRRVCRGSSRLEHCLGELQADCLFVVQSVTTSIGSNI